MSNYTDSQIFGDVPTGRRLESDDKPRGYVGSFGPLRRADEASLKAARKTLREIPAADFEGQQGLQLTEPTGEAWQVCTTFVDLSDPETSGAEAFVIREDLLVPLRPVGWKGKVTSKNIGVVGGYQVTGREPLGVAGPEVF